MFCLWRLHTSVGSGTRKPEGPTRPKLIFGCPNGPKPDIQRSGKARPDPKSDFEARGYPISHSFTEKFVKSAPKVRDCATSPF